MHYAHERKFSRNESLTCPECVQLSLVYCIIHETCGEQLLLHNSFAFCSPDIPGRKETKNTL